MVICKEMAARLGCSVNRLDQIIDGWKFSHISKVKIENSRTKEYIGVKKTDYKKIREILNRTKAITDLTGMRFNHLTVIKKCGKNKFGMVMWLCRCDCGNLIQVPRNMLNNGKYSKFSCGCVRRGKNNG